MMAAVTIPALTAQPVHAHERIGNPSILTLTLGKNRRLRNASSLSFTSGQALCA